MRILLDFCLDNGHGQAWGTDIYALKQAKRDVYSGPFAGGCSLPHGGGALKGIAFAVKGIACAATAGFWAGCCHGGGWAGNSGCRTTPVGMSLL